MRITLEFVSAYEDMPSDIPMAALSFKTLIVPAKGCFDLVALRHSAAEMGS